LHPYFVTLQASKLLPPFDSVYRIFPRQVLCLPHLPAPSPLFTASSRAKSSASSTRSWLRFVAGNQQYAVFFGLFVRGIVMKNEPAGISIAFEFLTPISLGIRGGTRAFTALSPLYIGDRGSRQSNKPQTSLFAHKT
jgi:hypothetical protein